MSWKATAFIKPLTHYLDGTKMRAAEKLLLFVLADDHNEDRGYAWPSQKTLARNALLSDRQVRRLLKKIVSKEWPIRVESQGKSGKREVGSDHYYFLFGADKMSSPGADISRRVRTKLRPVGEDIAMSYEPSLNRHLEPPKDKLLELFEPDDQDIGTFKCKKCGRRVVNSRAALKHHRCPK